MKKSLFTLTLFFLIALFISCTPIIKQDDLCQNDANVIISLSQPAARFTSSYPYTLSDYTWKLIIYEQNGTIRKQEDFNGGQTYQYQTKLEPAVYHISLTGTKRDSPSSNSAIPDTLQAEQTISVTEGEKVKNVILVPHSVYSGEGILGIYITFNLQDTPSVDLITVDAKLVNYYSKEEIPLKVGDFLITTTENQETKAQAYQLESKSTTESSSNTESISVPSGLYKIYINLNYKVNDMDKTITLVDDRVDNLLEVVSDKTTSYLLDLCSSTKLKYFTYHGSPSSEKKGNGSSADAPAYLDDILKKRYSNPNILEIVINDTTSTLSTSEGTEVPPVPNVDVDLLQEGITYTLNFSKTENDYTYSLKKTSPEEITLTTTCNSDLPLRFTNSSSNHINITFTPDTNTDIPSITPSLGKGVSLTYDNSTSSGNATSILIPSDLQYNSYYENIPYLIIKNPITESSDIPSQLTTSNQELDFSFATETTSDGSTSIKKYYLTTYSSTKVPLYTIDYNEIAYASLSDPGSFKFIEDADITDLIDLTIDKDNNLYLLYEYTPTVESADYPYKVKKMPRDGNPSKTYIINNTDDVDKIPISVKVGLDGEIYLILESSSNHSFAKLKKNDTYDYYDVVSLSEDSSSNLENIITSTITADSSGNIYIAKGTTTTTDQKELHTYTLTKYTVNGDNVYTRDDNYQPFLQLSSVSSDNYYKTYNLEGDSELKELFYSGTDENGNTYTSNNYLKLSDCYIKGDYIYITVSLFNNACRGTILKINLSDGKIAETPKLIDKNVYSSDSYNHDEGNFYGPSKIIAIKEDDLYIVDEGCIKNGSVQTKKNSLIKLNLNNLSSLSRIKDINEFDFDFSETSYSF